MIWMISSILVLLLLENVKISKSKWNLVLMGEGTGNTVITSDRSMLLGNFYIFMGDSFLYQRANSYWTMVRGAFISATFHP